MPFNFDKFNIFAHWSDFPIFFFDPVPTSSIGKFDNIKFARQFPEDFEINLVSLGSGYQIRWNVNKFEANEPDSINEPMAVYHLGAAAFANFYGFDVPLERLAGDQFSVDMHREGLIIPGFKPEELER